MSAAALPGPEADPHRVDVFYVKAYRLASGSVLGPALPGDRWAVWLRSQGGGWDIARPWQSHADAVRELEEFLAEGARALEYLRSHRQYGGRR